MGARDRQATRDRQMRTLIAQEAARLMATQGVRDFGAAKRKAAERLGAPDTRNLPRNVEVEAELVAYQTLFMGAEHVDQLRHLREAARQAMQFFAPFEPRLTGSVLSGTAGQHSDVNLHLFATTPEEVVLHLIDAEIPFEDSERRYRLTRETSETYPAVRLLANDVTIEAVIFPREGLRQAPLSTLDGRPMERASLQRLEELLAGEPESGLPLID
jgi:hypothetical protein